MELSPNESFAERNFRGRIFCRREFSPNTKKSLFHKLIFEYTQRILLWNKLPNKKVNLCVYV